MERTAKPTTVQYNDWRQVDVEPLETFTPTLPVSVVVPSWQTPPETLARTLAALEGQTCPRELFEVVIVDDGSEPPLRPPPTPLDVKVVRQERNGGCARARNAGARAAAHDILLFLDSDVLVEADWMAAHARWHHAVSDVVTVGSCADVSMDGIDADTIRRRPGSLRELFSDRPAEPRSAGRGHLIRTNDLTSRADDPFRVVAGGNFGVGKDFYELAGGHDESFVRWGMEEIEFGYRAYTRGGLFVPVRDAFAWHQGRLDGTERKTRNRSLRIQRAKAAHLIAHRGIRGNHAGRIFTVPQYVVTIDGRGRHYPIDRLLRTVMNILADRVHDLVVRIETHERDDDGRLEWLREMFGPEPRVRIGSTGSALDDHPASPFHVTLPVAAFNRDLVHRLRTVLGDAVTATARLPDGATVSITRAWALHRARRTGKNPADFGEARAIPTRALQPKAVGSVRSVGADTTHPAGYPREWDRLLDRARGIRSLGEAWSFLKWLAHVGRRRTADRLRLAHRRCGPGHRSTGGGTSR